MTDVARSLVIGHPPKVVWDALADFSAISQWAPNVDHSAPASEARSGPGAVRRVQLGRIALLERIVVWEPVTPLGYAITGLPPAAGTVTTVWELTPADGGTLATIRTTIEGVPGPPGKIVGRVLGRRMGRAATEMLNGIARYLDTMQEHS